VRQVEHALSFESASHAQRDAVLAREQQVLARRCELEAVCVHGHCDSPSLIGEPRSNDAPIDLLYGENIDVESGDGARQPAIRRQTVLRTAVAHVPRRDSHPLDARRSYRMTPSTTAIGS
jgi:hypothetical protein